MRRTTWLAVLGAVVVIAGGSLFSRVSWGALISALDSGSTSLAIAMRRVVDATPPIPAPALGAFLVALLAPLLLLLRPRERRASAARLMRRGRSAASVARRTKLAHDAVRYVARADRD